MEVYRGGAWNQITAGEAFAQGSWRTLSYGESFIGGVWRRITTFVQPLTLVISPSPFNGEPPFYGSALSQAALTATPRGGLAPFSYAWTAPNYVTLIGSATANCLARVSGGGIAASIQCIVTDSLGSTATTSVSGTFNA